MTAARYGVRFSKDPADIAAAQDLRTRAFGTEQHDCDGFDGRCTHVLIEDRTTGHLVCCLRLLLFPVGDDICDSYAAQFYDLSLLRKYPGKMVEVGRFCTDPTCRDWEALRLAWAAISGFVERAQVDLLLGCTSFQGCDPQRYSAAFARLAACHLGPAIWSPRVKATEVHCFADATDTAVDPKRAAQQMPPLLRSYLTMGAWVSDHAVVDRDMKTLHVFTAVERAAIPAARKRLLRATAL